LNAAFFVNASILILAATAFFTTGNLHVARIEEAHAMLAPLLGSRLAPVLFAIALIAAGQSSTVTGTLAGQIVMEGYLKLRLNPWIRRLLTRLIAIIPALLVIGIMGEEHVDALLILSQVILSLQLGFAVIPLIHFVSDKTTMGEFVINWKVKAMAWVVASILVFMNGNLVVSFVINYYHGAGNELVKILLILLVLLFLALLVYIIVFPIFLKRHHAKVEEGFHGEMIELDWSQEAPVNKIAIAVDFSLADARLIKTAIQIGSVNDKANLEALQKWLSALPNTAEVVIYCGCCKLEHCPNIRPAFKALNDMKFTNAKLLNLPDNLKVDWVDKGYPMED
jgi:manganese transport protein